MNDNKNLQKNFRIPIFCIITSLYWFSLYTYVPNLSPYAAELGASYKFIGMIVGSYGFTQMILRIPLGIYSDTIKKRKVFITIGLGVSVISALVVWISPSAITLFISRALGGVAAATWVTFTILFSSYYNHEEAPKAIGIINSFNSLGQVTAMLLGGLIAGIYGPRSLYLLAAIGGILGFILSFQIYENKDIEKTPIKLFQLLEVAKNRELILVSILAILSQFLTFATVFGFTPMIAEHLGANDFQLGLLSTLSILPGIFAAALSGTFFVKHLGEKLTLIVGFLINAVLCMAIPFIGSLTVLFVTQFIAGFGRGMVFPLLMGLGIRNISGGKRATAMGFFQAIYGIGMFLGPLILGMVGERLGLEIGFWMTGFIGILGIIIVSYNYKKAI